MYHLEHSGAPVYLVNTGWTGGEYGKGGQRFSIPTTRAIITGILDGSIAHSTFATLPNFNLEIPTQLNGIASELLDPHLAWENNEAYDAAATKLIAAFQNNFKKYSVAEEIIAAGPTL
jgi:phosphoenolpyruvate carboxykinase (ATP)